MLCGHVGGKDVWENRARYYYEEGPFDWVADFEKIARVSYYYDEGPFDRVAVFEKIARVITTNYEEGLFDRVADFEKIACVITIKRVRSTED